MKLKFTILAFVAMLAGYASSKNVMDAVVTAWTSDAESPVGQVVRIITPELTGSGTEDNPYIIGNADELELFRASVNAGETKYNAPGVWTALDADIDLAGVEWTEGIGDGHNWSYDGNFDGKGHVISNLVIRPYADASNYICGGLFGYIFAGVTIRNLIIENVTVKCSDEGHNVGALVGFANNNGGKAAISNIAVRGNIVVDAPAAYGVGTIIGYSYREMGSITNCSVEGHDGSYVNGHSFVGGITGYSNSNATITDCSVSNVDITATSYSVGGIAGLVLGGNVVSNCSVENVGVSGVANAGNIVGAIASNCIVVENCTATEPLVGGNYGDNQPVEARIGNAYYATLADAVAVANGKTITLVGNVVLDETLNVPYGTTTTLDLNGKSISQVKEQTAAYSMILNDGNLTIVDGAGGGRISYTDSGNGGEYISNTITNRAMLVVESGTIENLSSATVAYNGYPYAIDTNVWGTASAVNVVINGGKVACESYSAMRLLAASATKPVSVTVNGGEILGTIEVQNPSSTVAGVGNLTVNGGTLSNSGTANAIFIFGFGAVADDIVIDINGGDFAGNITQSESMPIGNGFNHKFISGGTFSNNIAEFCADGFAPVANADGTYGIVTGAAFVDGEFDNYTNAENKLVSVISYIRTLAGSGWNALYVPFSIPLAMLVDNYDISYINDVRSYDNDDDGTIDEMTMEVIKITDGTARLKANHPYLIRPKSEEAKNLNLTLNNDTLYAVAENTIDCSSMYTGFRITGTSSRRSAEQLEGSLVVSPEGEWVMMTTDTMNPFRMYLEITSRGGSPVKVSPTAARSIRIVTRGESIISGTTGIASVGMEAAKDEIYDLVGRKVERVTVPGIYIVNGKRVLIK